MFIIHGLLFSIIESEDFIQPFVVANPSAAECIPKYGGMMCKWIERRHEPAVIEMVRVFAESRSTIYLAANIWTSPNVLAFLGIVVYWMTWNGSRKNALLGIVQMNSKHDGENIAEELVAIIECFSFGDKLGYFIMNNATNNDHSIRILGKRYGFDVNKRCFRCLEHIINLVVHELLDILSTNVVSLAESSDMVNLHPLAKLHNIVNHYYISPQRREIYKQIAANNSLPHLMLASNNDTCWNLALVMIQTAIKQYSIINLFVMYQLTKGGLLAKE